MKEPTKVGVISLLLVLFAVVAQAQTYPSGMVSYWKFDEGLGTVAMDSIGTNNGNIYGATYVPGKLGTALNFNGTTDYVFIPASPLRQDLTKFTIECWVMPAVITSMAIVDNQVEDPSGMSGKIFFGIFDWGNGPSWGAMLEFTRYTDWGPALYDPSIVPIPGRWYHVATTWDGSNHVLFVDGEEIARGQTWFAYLPGSHPLPIGVKLWDHIMYWHGMIDEVAFYNRALTPEEVKGRYIFGFATFQSTLADIRSGLSLGLISNAGIATALSSKINAAFAAASRQKYDSERIFLQEFTDLVNAQTDKHINSITAQLLLKDASSLISQIPE